MSSISAPYKIELPLNCTIADLVKILADYPYQDTKSARPLTLCRISEHNEFYIFTGSLSDALAGKGDGAGG